MKRFLSLSAVYPVRDAINRNNLRPPLGGLSLTGFTLIEMMIVVGVILILATIGMPAMIRSKITGNESGAVANLKSLSTACNLYTFNFNDYPNSLNDLFITVPSYINFDFSTTSVDSPKDGYYYVYTKVEGDNPGFNIIARPSKFNLTGIKSFYVDQSGVIQNCNTKDCELPNPVPLESQPLP